MNAIAKIEYERPTIVRHQAGLMNKLNRVQSMQPMTHIDGVAVSALVEEYGSPVFVFSEKTLVERFREMRDAFTRRYPRVRMAWSFKTNYLDGVCRVFQKEGAVAEVVSEFEYDKAVNLGFDAAKIHFNGPYKPESALEKAFAAGATVHIDHFDELALAEKVAARLGVRPGVALRLNFSVDGTPAWSRFGFNIDNGQARDAVRRLIAGDKLDLVGIHCHQGTFIQDMEVYRSAARRMAEFGNELRREHGITLDFIDMGGGFASTNNLKGTYLRGDQVTPSITRYAEAICDGLEHLDYPPNEMPTLVLENGRSLVDPAGSLISTVLANKRMPDGRRGLVVDAGVNLLFTSFWYNHDVVPAQSFPGAPEPTIIYGPLCMNIDVVRETLLYPPMRVGERVVFRSVGAYNVTQWLQFITYRPAVVLISKSGRHGRIRRPENLQSILEHEERPEWL